LRLGQNRGLLARILLVVGRDPREFCVIALSEDGVMVADASC
jgi:hypothetical protein